MNLTITAPPKPTGDANLDIITLNNWCRVLFTQLKRTLYCIESDNITSLDADKLEGVFPLSKAAISGTNVEIGENALTITSPDKKQYLRLTDTGLEFCGTVVKPE